MTRFRVAPRRRIRRRRMLAVALAGSLLSGVLSGCSLAAPGAEHTDGTATYGEVADAVMAAAPRVVDVQDLTQSSNGFGHRLSLRLDTDSAESFTADELDAVIEAIWVAVPWEPNAIRITAGAETPEGRESVDLRAAAAELEHLGVTNAGTGGVTLTDMAARYGAWTTPG